MNYSTTGVDNCYYKGNVSGSSSVGGIVGSNHGRIENCYALVTVSASGSSIGGIAGFESGTVQYCVALQDTIATTASSITSIGRVASVNSGLAFNYGRAALVPTSGGSTIGMITSLVDKDGQNINPGTTGGYNDQTFWETTLGWDFTNVWEMSTATNPLPVLRNIGGQ